VLGVAPSVAEVFSLTYGGKSACMATGASTYCVREEEYAGAARTAFRGSVNSLTEANSFPLLHFPS